MLWARPAMTKTALEFVDASAINSLDDVPARARTLVAIGGGTRLDQAKYFRKSQRPDLRLIAVPSIWGSGAECSPVVVLNRPWGKEIHIDDAYLPDHAVYCREMIEEVPEELARYACGDAWSHVMEGFLSPLANADLREKAASLIRTMLRLPLAVCLDWLEASGRACALQARSSAGLIHGIAHTLELELRRAYPGDFWGHSRLCSLFLYPVLIFDQQSSPKCSKLCSDFDVDFDAVVEVARNLFDAAAYRVAMAELERCWTTVLRDRCTRTNVCLVAAKHLDFFRSFA